jgi:hypothetical protein
MTTLGGIILDPQEVDDVDTSIIAPPFVNRALCCLIKEAKDNKTTREAALSKDRGTISKAFEIYETREPPLLPAAECVLQKTLITFFKLTPKLHCYCGEAKQFAYDVCKNNDPKRKNFNPLLTHAKSKECHLWWHHAKKYIPC